MSDLPDASLSLDLDNKWAYLRAAGREDWESVAGYLPMAIDRMVDVLKSIGLPLTVFLVGRDLQHAGDVAAIGRFGELTDWEPANHSLNHLPWLHTMTQDEIESEIKTTHRRIIDATSCVPVGFRGPGFSCPDQVLGVLSANGYQYDASIFPTSMAPIARAVFLARTKLRGEQREKAKQLYGGFASMRQPNRPHRRTVETSTGSQKVLWEIPVTVMPLTRTPIHFSYVTFLAGFSITAAKAYFTTAMAMCRRLSVPPSLLLHPPDFLGREDDADMAYFPGMKLDAKTKLDFIRWALSHFRDHFDVHTLQRQLAVHA